MSNIVEARRRPGRLKRFNPDLMGVAVSPSEFRKAHPHLSDGALALAYAIHGVMKPEPVVIGCDLAKAGELDLK